MRASHTHTHTRTHTHTHTHTQRNTTHTHTHCLPPSLPSSFSVTTNSGNENLLKVNGSIPSSRSIPYQLSEQKDSLLHVADFMQASPNKPSLEFTMSPRGTSSFEFESINLRKMEPGVLLSSTESLQSTASN